MQSLSTWMPRRLNLRVSIRKIRVGVLLLFKFYHRPHSYQNRFHDENRTYHIRSHNHRSIGDLWNKQGHVYVRIIKEQFGLALHQITRINVREHIRLELIGDCFRMFFLVIRLKMQLNLLSIKETDLFVNEQPNNIVEWAYFNIVGVQTADYLS